MNARDKKDWIVEHFSGRWEVFIDPVELFDALHSTRPARIAQSLEAIVSGSFDAEGNVTDATGLAEELRALAAMLGAR